MGDNVEIITPFEICCGFGIGMRIDFTLWVKALYAIIVWPGYYLFKHVFEMHNPFCDPRLEIKASVICAMVTALVVEINQGMIFVYDNNNFFGIGDLAFAFTFTLIAAMVLLLILWSKKNK